jgi:Flp pilus assembly protein TadG
MARCAPTAGFAVVMNLIRHPLALGHRLAGAAKRFVRDRRGNITPLMALMVIPIVGSFGVVMETSNWYLSQRAMQNAADAAAVAASTSGGQATSASCANTAGTFDCEAKAAVASYTLVSGLGTVDTTNRTTYVASTSWTTSHVTVTTTYSTSGCPGTASSCYTVSIAKVVPLSLSAIVGFRGNTTLNGAPAQRIFASAIASSKGSPTSYCMTALGTSSTAIQFKGASQLDLTGCDIASNGGASCNGQSGNTIRYADVATLGSNKTCGTQRQATSTFTDTSLRALKTSIPAKTCGSSYPQASNKDVVDSAHQIGSSSSTTTWSTAQQFCGDIQLKGNISISSDITLMIYNGRLDLAGFTMSVQSGSGAHLTIILSGDDTSSNTYHHTIVSSSNGGLLDFTAPLSGTWGGVAIYQNPDLAAGTGTDLYYTGSNPDFAITGLVYVPKGNIDLSGAIGHSTEGFSCLSFVANTISINGTASLFAYPTVQCNRFGSFPVVGVPGTSSRLALIQ